MVKIVGGLYRSRSIEVPSGLEVPTKSIVRTAIANALNNDLAGTSVLDLFAGSGAVGIELISRGAKEAVFNDFSRVNSKVIEKNLSSLKITGSKVLNLPYMDAISLLHDEEASFDIVFLDPPYKMKEVYKEVPSILIKDGILKDNGILVLEYEGDIETDASLFSSQKIYTYGRSRVMILRR